MILQIVCMPSYQFHWKMLGARKRTENVLLSSSHPFASYFRLPRHDSPPILKVPKPWLDKLEAALALVLYVISLSLKNTNFL
jgi:hypothetical protein